MRITEREDKKPILGIVWLRGFNWRFRHIEKTTTINDRSEKDKIITLFEKLFKSGRTIKDGEIKIQLKPGSPPKEQKVGPKPTYLQSYVEKTMNNFLQSRHFEKVHKVEKNCFVSLVVLTLNQLKMHWILGN